MTKAEHRFSGWWVMEGFKLVENVKDYDRIHACCLAAWLGCDKGGSV
jgi:hypothetical protein